MWKQLLTLCCVAAAARAFSDNPVEDAQLDTVQLILKYGYPGERHHAITSDGYIVEMHRIPFGRDNPGPLTGRPAVLIMHGMFCSSADWVNMGPGSSLAYLLAEEGFDVWMGNARGNRYSRRHIFLNPDTDAAFWDFSWHEVGFYDLAAMIDYIVATTGQPRIHYLGHSQGTTTFFVLTSSRPEYNSRIRSMHAMAPVAYVNTIDNAVFDTLGPYYPLIQFVAYFLEPREMFPALSTVDTWIENFCGADSNWHLVCNYLVTGPVGLENLNVTMLPVILAHAPAGSSSKQISHFAQTIASGEFRQYDYGSIRNTIIYGRSEPPTYNVGGISTPVALYYSLGDTRVHPDDVYKLFNTLPNTIGLFRMEQETFTHLDYVWGQNAEEQVWRRIINFLNQY